MSEAFGQAVRSAAGSDLPAPVSRVFVTIGGTRWEMVPTGKLTWPEAKEAKRVCGMPLVDMEAAIQKADPDAWFAWMLVSIRRQWPSLTERELETAIGDTPVAAVIETAESEMVEVSDPLPPAQAPGNGADSEKNGNGSGELTPPFSTLETAGHQT